MSITKFILHGGNTRDDNSDNDAFFAEIAKYKRILLNYFARDTEKWEELAKQDKARLTSPTKLKHEFQIASEDDLINQIKWCNIMYIRGGETEDLKERLMRAPNWYDKIKGKAIAGSSAGVYILSKFYCQRTPKKIGKGLDILNIKTSCHFHENTDKHIIDKLSSTGKADTEILVLPDHKYVVLFK